MKTEITDQIMTLFNTGTGLKKFITEKLPKIRSEVKSGSSKLDKHRDGFETGRTPCQSVCIRELSYSSFTGSFGDSSTYSDISGLNLDKIEDYLVLYLNKHKDEIMLEIAEMMLADAALKKSEALSELNGVIEKLQLIGTEN